MDINESAVLQGIDAGKRMALMQTLVHDSNEIDGMEKQYIDNLFNLESQRAYVAELREALKGDLTDIDEENLAELKKTLSANVGTLVLFEVRFKSLEKTLGDIQARIKSIENAGTEPAL